MEPLLTNDMLDLMRKIGDPRAETAPKYPDEAAREALIEEARKQGLAWFLNGQWLKDKAEAFGVLDLLEPKQERPLPDPGLVKTACDLFARYGSEIAAALLLAALPEAYAAGEGAKVLARHSQLVEGGQLSTKRILATAQFVIWILTPGTLAPPVSADMGTYTYVSYDATDLLWGTSKDETKGQALRAALALRIMHSLIRTTKPVGMQSHGFKDPSGVPLNQEDLLATLLSFTITVFEVLEKFGIHWTAEEQEAYFYVWDHVGATLGIGDWHVIGELTGTGSLEGLMKELRRLDEGEPATEQEEGGPDDQEGASSAPPGTGRITSEDLTKLFEGPRGPLNRRVLRRVAHAGTLRPQSVPEARALLARLRERMWTLDNDRPPASEPFKYENFRQVLDDVSAGRILLRAMVDQVAVPLEASQKTWPIAVIRQLVPPPVQNRLALGATSSIGLYAGFFGTPRDMPGSAVLRRITAEVLRQRATRVADTFFLDAYDKGQIQIPGLGSAALGYGVRR